MTKEEQRRHNSTYPKGGVSCSNDSFVVNQTLVFQIKFCGKSPALRVAAKRWLQVLKTGRHNMTEIIERLSKIENGFKPIEVEAKNIFVSNSISDSMKLAIELLENDFYQVRSLAVFILGFISSKDSVALQILRTNVSNDKSWQVQEILAKSFDQHCMDTGYEKSLPIIKDWLSDKNPNVCRAVTEGLRIWTGRPYFKTNPQEAIQLISQHKSHESEYLRKSVGNSLRDISKKHKVLVDKEVITWDLSNKLIHFTYKFVTKSK